MRGRLVALANGAGTHVAVPLQGSGTFVLEAMLGTFVPRAGKLLILVNGAYGRRMAQMCKYYGRAHLTYETSEDVPPDPAEVDARLARDGDITHVAIVQCETTSGILNPVAEVARVVEKRGRCLLIDAMSGFGALPLDAQEIRFDAVARSEERRVG